MRADDGLAVRAAGAAGARAALLVSLLQPAGTPVLRRRVRLGVRLCARLRLSSEARHPNTPRIVCTSRPGIDSFIYES